MRQIFLQFLFSTYIWPMFGRVQNIYLSLTALILISSLFFNLATLKGDTQIIIDYYGAHAAGVDVFEDAPVLFYHLPMYLCVFSVLSCFLAIAFHNKVKKQLNWVYLVFISTLILVAGMFYGLRNITAYFGKIDSDVNYSIGLFMPVVALALVILSIRAIRKDIELVKSIDRIR